MTGRAKKPETLVDERRFIRNELLAISALIISANNQPDTPTGRRVQTGKVKVAKQRLIHIDNAMRFGLGRKWK